MPHAVETDRERRYLLRTLSDAEEERLEREYFASADALDRITATEEALIEAYLDGRLPADERQRFEEAYLSSSTKRLRVDTIRRLRLAAGANRAKASASAAALGSAAARRYAPLAAAAVLVIAVLAMTWRLRDHGPSFATPPAAPPQAANPAGPATPPGVTAARPPAIVALALSPIAMRSATASRPLVIPSGTDIVELELAVESSPVSATRVEVTTVAGSQVWSGEPTAAAQRNVVKVQIPASQLPPDDYLVTLLGRTPAGGDTEQHRYFLRVRARP